MSGYATDAVTAVPGRATRIARHTWRRKASLLGFAGIGLLLLVAVTAPWLAPYGPNAQNISNVLAPPVWAGGDANHVLGTDGLGRDVLSRLIYGARSSVLISVSAMLLGGTLGVLTGLTAGFLGRVVDTVIMRLGDVQLALPFILIAIVILGMMTDRDAIHIILVLGVPAWIVYARVVRSRVLSEREQDYVHAAKTLGASPIRQMFRYVLPQVRSVIPPIALIDLSHLVVMESTLSFLGFGLSEPSVSWGQILAEGRQNMVVSPWLPILPGIAIMLTILSINLAVEGARDTTTPRRRWFAAPRRRPPAKPAAPHGAEPDAPHQERLLTVAGLDVEFPVADDRVIRAVRGISFDVERGQIVGIVGESGSGKSVTAYAVMRLLAEPGRIVDGSILFDGTDLANAPEAVLRRLRGRRIGMMFQNPVGSLNPVLTVGYQIVQAIRTGLGVDREDARRRAEAALHDVGFGDPAHVLRQYPFRLSGGQNQRVMIAMTMVIEPELLLADEPTTALDVTTQAQVLDQLRRLRDEHETSIVLISHDIGLVGEVADQVVVVYAGQVCETGPTQAVLSNPQHPYTRGLLESVPRPEAARAGDLRSIPGDLPDPAREAIGCPFADRCEHVMDICRDVDPAMRSTGPGQSAACHLYSEDRRSNAEVGAHP